LLPQNIFIHESLPNFATAHVGLPHIWSVEKGVALVRELDVENYFREMHGNYPECWRDDLEGMDRWRMITTCFTQMRFIVEDGALKLAAKEADGNSPAGYALWFSFPGRTMCG